MNRRTNRACISEDLSAPFHGLLQKKLTVILLHISVDHLALLHFTDLFTYLYPSTTYFSEQWPSIHGPHGWGCLYLLHGWATWWVSGSSCGLCFIRARFVSLTFNQLHTVQNLVELGISKVYLLNATAKVSFSLETRLESIFCWAAAGIHLGCKKVKIHHWKPLGDKMIISVSWVPSGEEGHIIESASDKWLCVSYVQNCSKKPQTAAMRFS